MTNLDALHLINRVNQVVLQIARGEKPSGSWQAWAIQADERLVAIQKQLRAIAKDENQ